MAKQAPEKKAKTFDMGQIVAGNNKNMRQNVSPDEIPAQMILALSAYAESQSVEYASKVAKVTPNMVRKWVNNPDNEQLIRDCRDSIRAGMAHRYLEILTVSTNQLMHRLSTGDVHVTRDGSLINVPIKARDLIAIADVASQRHAVLTGNVADSMPNTYMTALAERILQVSQERRDMDAEQLATIDHQPQGMVGKVPGSGGMSENSTPRVGGMEG